jgi:hypothetical protein
VRSPRPDREVFRLVPPLVLWWVWVAFAVANVADFAIQGAPARFAIVVSAILVAITGLAYALALRPRVIADPSGLTIVNPFRDHHVPWAAIQAVDAGDWVRVHYAPAAPGSSPQPSSATSKAISCWALYISAGAKRKAARTAPAAPGFARPAPRPRRSLTRSGNFAAIADRLAAAGQEPGQAGHSRLPEEAKYLASLPPAQAIAVRLDTRADRERARLAQPSPPPPGTSQSTPPPPGAPQPSPAQPPRGNAVTARWAWPAMAAVTVPLLALLVILLV